MSISKQMMMMEMDRIEREEYDEDGNPSASQMVKQLISTCSGHS